MVGSKFFKIGVAAAGALLMSASAWASCAGSTYCKSSMSGHTLTPISNYQFNTSHRSSSPVLLQGSSATAVAYAAAGSSRALAASYAGSTGGQSAALAYSAARSGSSVVTSGALASSSTALSTGRVTSLRAPGLGAGERLCEVSCPTAVHNPHGGKVLGCYNICKPVKPFVKRVVRHVRPVYYVRYAVPVPVCYNCSTPQYATRYGIYNW